MNESALPNLDAALTSPVVRIERDAGTPAVALDPDSPFEDLREAVRALFDADAGLASDLAGHAVRLDFGRRDLALFDLRRLVHLLRDDFNVTVAGITCTPEALHRYAEQSLKLRVTLCSPEDDVVLEEDLGSDADPTDAPEPGLALADEAADQDGGDASGPADTDSTAPDATAPEADAALAPDDSASADAEAAADPAADAPAPADPPDVAGASAGGGAPDATRVFAVHRTLRSGARVRHPGDVIVFGDVNAGAQVEADGNIVVLGALRGLAHAGARGDEGAVIISFDLSPTQLRIGNRIAFPPEKAPQSSPRLLSLLSRDRDQGRGFSPEIARVDGASIVLEEYRGRLPSGGR